MEQLSIAQILSASSNIIANPNKSVFEELGVNAEDVLLFVESPLLFIAKKVNDLMIGKRKADEEKERMYQEIINKQQATIKKQQEVNRELEKRLRESDASNAQNQAEIRKLRQQLKNLKDILNLLMQAKRKVA